MVNSATGNRAAKAPFRGSRLAKEDDPIYSEG